MLLAKPARPVTPPVAAKPAPPLVAKPAPPLVARHPLCSRTPYLVVLGPGTGSGQKQRTGGIGRTSDGARSLGMVGFSSGAVGVGHECPDS